jgi:hypothetical protein
MAKLNVETIHEIASKQRRASRPDQSANWRLSILLQTFNDPAKHQEELLRYYPIAVVAAIEGYLKERLASLIDLGDPFAENAITHFGKTEIDLGFARAFSDQTLSLGAVIMHSMSLSSLPKVLGAVTKITGRSSFKDELKAICPKTKFVKRKPIIGDSERMWAQIAEAYEHRHVLCHELADNFSLNPDGVRQLLLHTQQFVQASIVWFEELEKPYLDKRAQQKLDKARGTIQHEEKRFAKLIGSSITSDDLSPEEQAQLDNLRAHYSKFRKLAGRYLKPLFSVKDGSQSLMDSSVTAAALHTALNRALEESTYRIAMASRQCEFEKTAREILKEDKKEN